jgi:hypothetical protein
MASSRTTARVAIALAALQLAAAIITLLAAYANLTRGKPVAGVAFILVMLMFLFFASVWWSRRGVEVTVDDAGLDRAGRHGWHLDWADIKTARVATASSMVGSQPGLLLDLRPEALTPELAASARASRTLLRGVTTPSLVVPLDPTAVAGVSTAIDSHLGGGVPGPT